MSVPPESTQQPRPAERDLVGSLERGLSVLEILAAHPDGMTLSEMAEAAALTRAGARRFLLTLVATGYATQAGRRFSLSPKLIAVARSWLSGRSLWSFAEPIMREVSATLNESCSAAVLSGTDIVYVARIPGRHILSVSLQVGSHLPAYCTSMGRVLLAGLPEKERDALLSASTIRAMTPKTLTDIREVRKAIEGAGRDGYAIIDEELELGLRSLAVPLHDRTGRIVAAINVSTQSGRMSVEAMREAFLPVLKSAALRIEDYFAVQ